MPTPAVLAKQPMWTWFMIWGNFVNSHNRPEAIRDLYGSPRVLSHEDFARPRTRTNPTTLDLAVKRRWLRVTSREPFSRFVPDVALRPEGN